MEYYWDDPESFWQRFIYVGQDLFLKHQEQDLWQMLKPVQIRGERSFYQYMIKVGGKTRASYECALQINKMPNMDRPGIRSYLSERFRLGFELCSEEKYRATLADALAKMKH